jgi:hypothetical protein
VWLFVLIRWIPGRRGGVGFYARREDGVSTETFPIKAAIPDTARAAEISSIHLIEMRICGLPVVSLQAESVDRNYYCLPFASLGIARLRTVRDLAAWLDAPANGAVPPAAEIHLSATAKARELLAGPAQAKRSVPA